ncbi:peptidoglycan recognition family protein [Leptospira sp. 96542]|nr:peptidoglycan recognition family protein [Leptospira sp. 96542]
MWQKLVKISLIFLIFTGCSSFFKRTAPNLDNLQITNLQSFRNLPFWNQYETTIQFKSRNASSVTAIVLHTTGKKKLEDYLKSSIQNQFMVHFYVDTMGNVFGDPDFLKKEYVAAPGIDTESIHISYEGSQETLYNNSKQKQSLQKLIDHLAEELLIPKTNQNIISKKGIFTHNQTKRRFGGFVDFSACGGELALKQILNSIGGKYFEEEEWVDRFVTGWALKKESKQLLKETFKPTNGRGITKPSKVVIDVIEKDETGFPIENYRVKYTFKGKIKPTCIVLHYTAIPDYFDSLRTLENRDLTATIMVDKNGKVYQLVDVLEDRAAAASGTNDNCIQIEIVAKDTNELLAQTEQLEKVKELVIQLSKKYKIPYTNQDIESFSGIFSHTQAKKKWGGSIFLNAKDFDPGEEYMELILNSIGGKYYPESEWKNRSNMDWAILYRNFQP